jgi:MOSC domain-containing protein
MSRAKSRAEAGNESLIRDTRIGTLSYIWRYPVKSLRGEALQSVHVGTEGLEGDRRRALVMTTEGHARTGKPYRGKEHNLLHLQCDAETAGSLVARRGLRVEVRDDGPFFDDQPVSVLLDCWLRELEAIVGMALDPQRFRPNLYVESSHRTAGEAEFVGATIDAGGVSLRVVSPIERCVTTTYDQVTGESNPAVLRALANHRDTLMGVYCTVERTGLLKVGDAVRAPTAFDGPPAPSPA